MAIGALVLRQTLHGTSDGSELPIWSIALAFVWIAGWLALVTLTPRQDRRAFSRDRSTGQRHPLAFTIAVGIAFAVVSLFGALLLRELPVFGDDVSGTTSRVMDSPVAVFMVALGTGVAEELFFRLGLSRLLPYRWFPFFSTAAYGAVTLATGNLALTIAAVLLGATSSIALTMTRRWYTPVIVHASWTVALVGVFPLL